MKSNNRFVLYIRNIFVMTKSSKIRFILTFIGILFSVFGFAFALIISDSYFESRRDIYSSFASNSLLISSNQPSEDKINLFLENKNYSSVFIDVISKNYYFIDSFDSINGQSVSITTTLHGVETTEVVSQYDGMHYMPFLSSIKNGREINWGDIQSKEKTVMIDEYTAELLYGSIKDAIGQSIVIDGGRGLVSEQTSSSPQKHSFIISGVCENSKLTEHNRVENRKKIKKGSDNVIINIDLYCPISTIFDLYPDLDYYRNYIVTFGSQNEANDFYNKTIDTNGNQYGISYIVSKDSLMADITLQMKETKRIIVLGILLLSFIFGISIISVVFFATKERIPEIGIRKAFGAEKLDIVFQIFCEMLLISGLASIIGVFAALYFSKLLEYYLINELCIYFVLNITAGDIVTPIFVGVLQSAIFGMIPGIYGASIPITDALKFE